MGGAHSNMLPLGILVVLGPTHSPAWRMLVTVTSVWVGTRSEEHL